MTVCDSTCCKCIDQRRHGDSLRRNRDAQCSHDDIRRCLGQCCGASYNTQSTGAPDRGPAQFACRNVTPADPHIGSSRDAQLIFVSSDGISNRGRVRRAMHTRQDNDWGCTHYKMQRFNRVVSWIYITNCTPTVHKGHE